MGKLSHSDAVRTASGECAAGLVATVNGAAACLPADDTRLIDWLRTTAGITGPKEGCGQGHCGACTVLIDGRPALACCVLAVAAAGCQVMTAEGLAGTPLGQRLAAAFAGHGAVQCGYCAPGMLTAAYAFLARRRGRPASGDVRGALAGNVCRCTGYAPIIDAVRSVRPGRDDR